VLVVAASASVVILVLESADIEVVPIYESPAVTAAAAVISVVICLVAAAAALVIRGGSLRFRGVILRGIGWAMVTVVGLVWLTVLGSEVALIVVTAISKASRLRTSGRSLALVA
jgi:hypothetical protein